jgi:hypothetical protein
MNEDDRIRIVKEIHAARMEEHLRPDEITHRMYADINGVTISVAKRALTEEVESGRMTVRRAKFGAHHLLAYRRSEPQGGDH